MVAQQDIYVKFPDGAFSMAGDYGSDRITTRYDNDQYQGVLYTGRYTNIAGGGGIALTPYAISIRQRMLVLHPS